MKIYLKTGFTSGFIPVTLALSLVLFGALVSSISISTDVVKSYIDGLIFQTIVLSGLALVGFTFTVGLALLLVATALEFYRDWIREAREAMWLRRHQELKELIASMKPIYRKYRIYPELRIYQDYQKYY